jgi:aspartyl-tRNA synthetase
MTYREAMDRFGSDKPDTRFGLELQDVSDLVADCGFQVFTGAVKNGGSVRIINAKGFNKGILSRRDIDGLGEFVKTYKAKGLAWITVKEDGLQSSILKFLDEKTIAALMERANAEVGDIIFFVADKNEVVYAALGALRLRLAEIAKLIDENTYDILWVTEFPMLEWDEEENRCVAVHHPFTSPKTEDLPLLDTEPLKVRAKAYDLVINGQEAGGGSIRIHSREVQKKMFNVLGFTDEQIEERFGFFVNAFNYGTPPHGGLAFGLDRLVMLLSKTDNIKDVIAFPKVQNASDLMTEAPSPVEMKQLNELAIKIDEQ